MKPKKNTSKFYIGVPLPSETIAKKILYYMFLIWISFFLLNYITK